MDSVPAGVPTAICFIESFNESFASCRDGCTDRDEAWQDLTAFMTGKYGKRERDSAVLTTTAHKLNLEYQHEFLHLDMVLYSTNGPLGRNFVFIEHENEIRGFRQEIENLMSVVAPLKIGITYVQEYREKEWSRKLLEWIREYFPDEQPRVWEPR